MTFTITEYSQMCNLIGNRILIQCVRCQYLLSMYLLVFMFHIFIKACCNKKLKEIIFSPFDFVT